MARLPDAPTWQAANPGKGTQDYYNWMYQPQQYTQHLGATAAEASAFDPSKSALDSTNLGANKALIGRLHGERVAGASNPQRQAAYAQRMQVYNQNLARAPGFAGVSPGLQPPGGGTSAGAPPASAAPAPAPAPMSLGAGKGLGTAPAAPATGFAGVQRMGATDRIRQQQAARAAGGSSLELGRPRR